MIVADILFETLSLLELSAMNVDPSIETRRTRLYITLYNQPWSLHNSIDVYHEVGGSVDNDAVDGLLNVRL